MHERTERGSLDLLGRTAGARIGSILVAVGIGLLAYGGLWQAGLAPGSHVSVPEPVALQRSGGREAVAPTAQPVVVQQDHASAVGSAAAESERPTAVPAPAVAVSAQAADVPRAADTPSSPPARDDDWRAPAPAPLVAADRTDRIVAARGPRPGYAVRLAIQSIHLDTKVQQGGVDVDSSGQPYWVTLPFVAVHYGDLTALVGAPGNAVIAGHVATLAQGNVFQFLYQVDLGDEVRVWDDHGDLHRFEVTAVRLVPPSDTSVMAETPQPTLTLITCGGDFDPVKREFSDRLIVTALPVDDSSD